jgi:hypothetical protein
VACLEAVSKPLFGSRKLLILKELEWVLKPALVCWGTSRHGYTSMIRKFECTKNWQKLQLAEVPGLRKQESNCHFWLLRFCRGKPTKLLRAFVESFVSLKHPIY